MSYTILEERRVQKWRDYTATALWMLGNRLSGDGWRLEPYIEFAYPETAVADETPDQIKQRIVRRLTA